MNRCRGAGASWSSRRGAPKFQPWELVVEEQRGQRHRRLFPDQATKFPRHWEIWLFRVEAKIIIWEKDGVLKGPQLLRPLPAWRRLGRCLSRRRRRARAPACEGRQEERPGRRSHRRVVEPRCGRGPSQRQGGRRRAGHSPVNLDSAWIAHTGALSKINAGLGRATLAGCGWKASTYRSILHVSGERGYPMCKRS